MTKATRCRQAHDWLKAALTALGEMFKFEVEARPYLIWTQYRWKQEPGLAGVREPEALARLPEAERERWQAFWAEVDRLHATEGHALTPQPDDPDSLDSLHRRAHELEFSKPAEAEPLFRRALEGYRKAARPDGAADP